jgi:hypothetical protein
MQPHRRRVGRENNRSRDRAPFRGDEDSVSAVALGAALGREFYGPEAWGGAEEFEAHQGFAPLSFYYAGDAAGEFFVGLQVGHQEFLRGQDFRGECEEAAGGADVERDGVLGEGLIVRVAVNEDGHEGGDAVRAAFVGWLMWRWCCSSRASRRRGSPRGAAGVGAQDSRGK